MKKLYITLALGLVSLVAAAQTLVSDALPFVQLDYNPASIAMGSTSVPTVAYLPLDGVKIAGGVGYQTYMPQISATKYIGAGVAGSLDKLGYSLSFVNGTGEKISSGASNFTPKEMMVDAGLSYAFLDFLALGVNVKYAREVPWENNSIDAVAADVFVAGKLDAFDFALGVSSLGQKVKAQSSSVYSFPTAFTVGAGYTVILADDHSIDARVKGDYYTSTGIAAGLGLEYCYSGMVFARAGYHYGGDSIIPSFASAGLGVDISGITLDVSYLFASDVLKGSFAISAGVRF